MHDVVEAGPADVDGVEAWEAAWEAAAAVVGDELCCFSASCGTMSHNQVLPEALRDPYDAGPAEIERHKIQLGVLAELC